MPLGLGIGGEWAFDHGLDEWYLQRMCIGLCVPGSVWGF